MTTEKIVSLYKVLSNCKLTKIGDQDKYVIIKILRKLRPTAESFEAFQKDAQEKLKPENWEEIMEKVQKWQSEGDKTTLTEEEKKEINDALVEYDKKISECMISELEVEVDIEFPKISEAGFEKLLASNDWNTGVAMFISDSIVAED